MFFLDAFSHSSADVFDEGRHTLDDTFFLLLVTVLTLPCHQLYNSFLFGQINHLAIFLFTFYKC